MKTLRNISLFVILAASILLSGCVSSPTRHADELSIVKHGVLTAVHDVRLAGEPTGAGALIGGAAGASVGISGLRGGWRTALVGAFVGQVVGAVAGHTIEKAATESNGVELIINLDDSAEVAITQRRDVFAELQLKPGDRVRIVSNGRTNQVSRD
jgi:outer membrane lipoprotein SlyB